MSVEPQFFTDLEGTIPAREGDRVALAKNLGGRGTDMQCVFRHQRPLLKDGHLYFDGTIDEIDRLRAENARLAKHKATCGDCCGISATDYEETVKEFGRLTAENERLRTAILRADCYLALKAPNLAKDTLSAALEGK